MKNISCIICTILLLVTSCNSNSVKIEVENTCNFDRLEDIAEIDVSLFSTLLNIKEGETYLVREIGGEKRISQVTYDGKLIFQPQLKANETKAFLITKGAQTDQQNTKVYAKHHPERKDDLAWENDRVGFKYYATALEKTDGPSNGLDIWYKRTNKIVLDEWYKNDIAGTASYHVDHGEGCDPYGVGRTLGAGSIAPLVNGNTILNRNYTHHEIYENGPLRASFRLDYPDLIVDGKTVSEYKIISLDAGSQLTKIEQHYGNKEDMPVAVGIVKRNQPDSIHYKQGQSHFIYQEPFDKKNDQIFVGAIIPQGIDSILVEEYEHNKSIKRHTLAATSIPANTPITYYAGFGWSKFGFEEVGTFNKYLQEFTEGIKHPFVVKIEK